MVIKNLSQLYVGAVLSLGCAPYLQACVPMARQYVMLMLKTGNSAIVKEYVTLDMRLVLQYFGSDKLNLATSASNVAFQVLQRAVRRQILYKRGSKKIVLVIAECIIVGLEEIMKAGGPEGAVDGRLRMVLGSASQLFADNVDRNQISDAKDLSKAWLILLMTAIDPPKRNGRKSPTLNYLLQAWAAILQCEALADFRKMERLLDRVAEDIRDWCEKDQKSCNNAVKVWIHLLHVSVRDYQNAASTIISTTLVHGLQRAIGNGHHEMIRQALADSAISLGQNIMTDDVQSIKALYESTKLLHTVARSQSRDVYTLLNEAFSSNINEAAGYRGDVVQTSPAVRNASAPYSPREPAGRPRAEMQSHQPPEFYGNNETSTRGFPVGPARGMSINPLYELSAY